MTRYKLKKIIQGPEKTIKVGTPALLFDIEKGYKWWIIDGDRFRILDSQEKEWIEEAGQDVIEWRNGNLVLINGDLFVKDGYKNPERKYTSGEVNDAIRFTLREWCRHPNELDMQVATIFAQWKLSAIIDIQ